MVEMVEVPDGTVPVVFGVMLTPDQYEARPGHLEFRAGRLVEAQFGRHAQRDEAGLTVGLVIFPVPPSGCAEARARAVVRVYSRGTLHGETDLGAVAVHIDPA
jgi:hypothetical protein